MISTKKRIFFDLSIVLAIGRSKKYKEVNWAMQKTLSELTNLPCHNDTHTHLIPLDLVMDYPVNWEFWRILRDLIQNFYDSIGYKNFNRDFYYHYEYDDNSTIKLIMRTKGYPFSYEWLTYFGGSTKTEKEGYIGKYGEGFKICALGLVKMGYHFTMESQGWSLSPSVYTVDIDGQNTDMLGYMVMEREDNDITSLVITGIDIKHQSTIEEGMLNFFYPENPLFGRCLANEDDYAIYERSDQKFYIGQYQYNDGLLYFHNLARGILPFNLIVIAKNQIFDSEKRDRNTFYSFESISLIYKIACAMKPKHAYLFLQYMENEWSALPKLTKKEPLDLDTWYYVVCQLVRNIATDHQLVNRFHSEYPHLMYLDRISSDNIKNRKIKRAKEWYYYSTNKEKLVNPIFRLLRVPSLIEKYQEDIENRSLSELTDKQLKMGRILEKVYNKTIPLSYDSEPPIIMISDSTEINPFEFCSLEKGIKKKKGTLTQKYKVEKIIFHASDFRKDCFQNTFLKYCICRFRAYGTDRSKKMTMLLTYLGSWMYQNSNSIKAAEEKWKEASDETN